MTNTDWSTCASNPASSGTAEIAAVFETPPTLAPEARYRDRTLIGSGQMGRVESAYDTLLRREVALKVLRADASEGARERFAREASITAGLEHPGIVTVHDSGTLDDGRPYYTMQLVRGGPWALRDDDDVDQAIERIAAIGEAVGHAHGCGIVHRDLKPANIMVGAFGEVVVVDWGLATHERVALEVAETLPILDSGLTAHGAVIGTPLYMSPEQARGEPVRPSADVWALGIMLHERLTGRHPFEGVPLSMLLARVRIGDVPALPGSVSPELAAIVDRALSLRPSERYATGAELARDLRNFAAGRRVGAYVYRPLDVLTRFIRAHRMALTGTGVAAGLLLAVGVSSYAQNVVERDRARAAESEARAAERVATEKTQANERLSGRLLAAQARVAAASGDLAAAEFLAEAALSRGESADARGVLASTGYANHPVDVLERPSPCPNGTLSSRGERLLCLDRHRLRAFDTASLALALDLEFPDILATAVALDETGQTWVIAGSEVIVHDREGKVVRSEAASSYDLAMHGPTVQLGVFERSQFLAPDGTFVDGGQSCDGSRIADFGYGHGHMLLICRDGSAHLDGAVLSTPPDDRLASTDTIVPLGDGRFFLGRDDGRVTVFDPATRSWDTTITGAKRIGNVTDLHGGLVALTTEDMDTLIWDIETASAVVRLPPSWGGAHAGRDDDTFVSVGTSIRTWKLPPQRSSPEFQAEFGIAMATASDRNGVVIAGLGDGSVIVWGADDGQLRWRAYWPDTSVLKAVAMTRDERHILGMTAQDGRPRVFRVEDGRLANILPNRGREHSGGRRLFTLKDGSVWASTYGTRVLRWPDVHSKAEPRQLEFGHVEDASASEHGDVAIWLEERTDRASIVRSGSSALEHLGVVEGAHALDVDDDATLVVAGREQDVLVLDLALNERQRWSGLPARVIDVSIRGDGSLVAAGLRDGSIVMWRIGDSAPLARLLGHDSRIANVEFVGEALMSAAWDAAARRWALAPLLARPEALQQAAARWGAPPTELRDLLQP